MDSVDGRGVNWAHPMNNSTHLPPKSPHGSYSMFSSGSLFESGGRLNSPIRGHGEHRRSPSAGYIPPPLQQQGQATWLSDRLGSPDVVLKKCSHRRSSSDSVAFVDNSYQYMNYLEHVTEEEEFVQPPPPPSLLPSYRPTHRRGMSADHGSDDHHSFQYELPTTHRSYPEKGTRGGDCRLFRDSEPFQWQPRQENIAAYNNVRTVSSNLEKFGSLEDRGRGGKKLVALALVGKSDNALLASSRGGRNHCYNWSHSPTFENRSTASESNSHSDDSNDDNMRAKSYERFRSDSEARSEDGGDGGCTTSSDSVDPKKAKRILANRQSAQRSRVRKLQYISELEMNVSLLEAEVASLSPKVGYFDHERVLLSAENALLKQKLAALAKTQRLKEAYNETLKTEVQRLRQICTQQNQQYSQLSPQQPLSPDSVELQLLRFSKLDLGPPNIPKPKSPTAYPSGSGRISTGKPSLYPTTSKAISPTHARNSNLNATTRSSSSLAVRGGQTLMMGSSSTGTSFMVHNST